ncbi:hypothetical protein [Hyphococcus sp. DH-69]|uniref:hypothetical protein n=1 Tax=Hyphococcus formosus TaxID=3143534 RepID=UPI00398A8007
MPSNEYGETRSTSAAWFYVPVLLILFLGGALSVGAYLFSDSGLTIAESIVAGYAGLAAIIVAMVMTVFGMVLGLIGALFGIAAAGGAVAFTLFIIGSPIIALILIFMLMRRSNCPDPAAHE